MPIANPEPGLVISYAYLWRYEHQRGLEEGRKNRPCVIVLAVETHADTTIVTVAPITHIKPTDMTTGIEIPPRVKQHLGLDHEKSWVITTEVNQFVWPGYDLRPLPNAKHKMDYGFLPPNLFERIQSRILDQIINRRSAITARD